MILVVLMTIVKIAEGRGGGEMQVAEEVGDERVKALRESRGGGWG